MIIPFRDLFCDLGRFCDRPCDPLRQKRPRGDGKGAGDQPDREQQDVERPDEPKVVFLKKIRAVGFDGNRAHLPLPLRQRIGAGGEAAGFFPPAHPLRDVPHDLPAQRHIVVFGIPYFLPRRIGNRQDIAVVQRIHPDGVQGVRIPAPGRAAVQSAQIAGDIFAPRLLLTGDIFLELSVHGHIGEHADESDRDQDHRQHGQRQLRAQAPHRLIPPRTCNPSREPSEYRRDFSDHPRFSAGCF